MSKRNQPPSKRPDSREPPRRNLGRKSTQDHSHQGKQDRKASVTDRYPPPTKRPDR